MTDNVNHPSHYTGFSNGAEIIDITENLSFNLGNVVKYVARAGRKTRDPFEDLKKAQFYLNREIARIQVEYDDDEEPEDLPALPVGLSYSEFKVWEDSDGEEWRWHDGTWFYRTPSISGWIEITGTPSSTYGPFKEKRFYG